MKVLLFDTTQAYLTPGGKQVHAQKLFENLPKVNVEVDYAKWWDPNQTFDIVHFFGYNAPYIVDQVKSQNKRAVLTQVMDAQTNFTPFKKKVYNWGSRIINALPNRFSDKFYMTSLNKYDALVYMHHIDKETAVNVFNVNQKKAFIIPHASDPIQAVIPQSKASNLPEKYLVSAGSIVERKRSILLAALAIKSKIPIIFIGPADKNSSYYERFATLVDNKYVFYFGYVDSDRKIELLSGASGFVLLSKAESGCIAVHEAASLGLPLLLADAPWAKCYPEPKAVYYCNYNNFDLAVEQLRSFYQDSTIKEYASFRVHNWEDIALMYRSVYEEII